MMNEREFIDSQKECAAMLGMSLHEYQKYCDNLKVPTENIESEPEKDDETLKMLSSLGIDKSKLKKRREN